MTEAVHREIEKWVGYPCKDEKKRKIRRAFNISMIGDVWYTYFENQGKYNRAENKQFKDNVRRRN